MPILNKKIFDKDMVLKEGRHVCMLGTFIRLLDCVYKSIEVSVGWGTYSYVYECAYAQSVVAQACVIVRVCMYICGCVCVCACILCMCIYGCCACVFVSVCVFL